MPIVLLESAFQKLNENTGALGVNVVIGITTDFENAEETNFYANVLDIAVSIIKK